MALPSRPQEQGPAVSGDPPSAALLPRKAPLPDLVRLLPRSRRRGLEGVGATPKPTIENKSKEQVYVSQRTSLIGFTGQEPKTFATQSGKEITRLSVTTTRRYQQDSEWKEKTQWHECVLYGGAAQYAAHLSKGTHVFIEGELTYREYTRTIESESGSVNVQWPLLRLSLNRSKFSIVRRNRMTSWREPLSGSPTYREAATRDLFPILLSCRAFVPFFGRFRCFNGCLICLAA